MAGEIVVGVGPDASGEEAARYGATLAATFGTSLVLVFGYEATSIGPRGGPLEDQFEAVAAEITSELSSRLREQFPDVNIDVELVRDRPVDSLLRVAEARSAAMIVVGHGGRGPLRAALLGSTTYEIVHRAATPVVVVPDPVQPHDE